MGKALNSPPLLRWARSCCDRTGRSRSKLSMRTCSWPSCAQAEGAIEGTYMDYVVHSPFSTAFKYARFDATASIEARNVSLLSGAKMAAKAGAATLASSMELHGAETA